MRRLKSILTSAVIVMFSVILLITICPSIHAQDSVYGRDVDQSFFTDVLNILSIPSIQRALDSLIQWQRDEYTRAYWNPLATTHPVPGKSYTLSGNPAGVQNYADRQTGVEATAWTLNLGYYNAIRDMLSGQSFDRGALEGALNEWSGNGRYVDPLIDYWWSLWNNPPGGGGDGINTGCADPLVVIPSYYDDPLAQHGTEFKMHWKLECGGNEGGPSHANVHIRRYWVKEGDSQPDDYVDIAGEQHTFGENPGRPDWAERSGAPIEGDLIIHARGLFKIEIEGWTVSGGGRDYYFPSIDAPKDAYNNPGDQQDVLIGDNPVGVVQPNYDSDPLSTTFTDQFHMHWVASGGRWGTRGVTAHVRRTGGTAQAGDYIDIAGVHHTFGENPDRPDWVDDYNAPISGDLTIHATGRFKIEIEGLSNGGGGWDYYFPSVATNPMGPYNNSADQREVDIEPETPISVTAHYNGDPSLVQTDQFMMGWQVIGGSGGPHHANVHVRQVSGQGGYVDIAGEQHAFVEDPSRQNQYWAERNDAPVSGDLTIHAIGSFRVEVEGHSVNDSGGCDVYLPNTYETPACNDPSGQYEIVIISAALPPSAILGDLNDDGKVNVQDATLSLRISVGLLTPTDAQKTAGDVNKDGKLNVQDTTLILQVAVGVRLNF